MREASNSETAPQQRAARVALRAFAAAMTLAVGLSDSAFAGAASDAGATPGAFQGVPPYDSFAPDLDVFPQNFGIVQDTRGIVYVGNYEGLLEFDGERWFLTRMPNGDLARSLAVDARGMLYAGGYNLFGYFARDARGLLQFTDLAPRFAGFMAGREIADIWEVVVAPEGVYFRATQDLFFWDPQADQVRHWHSPKRFGAMVHHAGKTYLQFRELGLRVRDGNDWRPLEGTQSAKDALLGIVPMADGDLLAFGRDGRWLRLNAKGLTPMRMPTGMPSAANFSHGLALSDGSIVLSHNDGTVTLVAPDFAMRREIKVDVSYLSGLTLARDGGFLVAGQQRIHRVQWPSVWSVLRSEEGADGDISRIAEWNGQRYVLTSSGARVARETASGLRFEKVPWGAASFHDLIELTPTRALVAEAHRLKLLDGGRLSDLSNELIYPRSFQRSVHRPGRVFMGTEAGLRILDVAGGQVRIGKAYPANDNLRVYGIVEVSAGELWACTERHGVLRYTLDADGEVARVDEFGAAQGLRFGKVADANIARLPNGDLVATTREGFFRFDGTRFVEAQLDGLEKLRAAEEFLALVPLPSGETWAYGPTRLYHRAPQGAWHVHGIRSLRRGAIVDHYVDAASRATFIGTNSLIIHHGDRPASEMRSQPMWRRVTRLNSDGTSQSLPVDSGDKVLIEKGQYGVRFEFALPELVRSGIKRYQARMSPIEDTFSDWAPEARYTYSDLQARDFTFEIRAMDSAGNVTPLPPYKFEVVPPWYLGVAAKLAYLAVGLLGVFALALSLARYRTARLNSANVELERKVESRTRELGEAIRRLDMMAHVDGLTGIANRRRLDEYLPAVWASCADHGRPLSLLAVDVDHFKEYNDNHGHVAGDEILKTLSRELMSCLRRAEDLLARFGGEEFIIVMPGADALVAVALAESLRGHIESLSIGVTVSIGVATLLPEGAPRHETLLTRADEALYAAKRGGRNRVCVYGVN